MDKDCKKSIIDSSKCLECEDRLCSGKELSKLGFKKIICPKLLDKKVVLEQTKLELC